MPYFDLIMDISRENRQFKECLTSIFFLFIAVFQDNFISFLFRKNVTSITVACETGNWANESFLPIYYISLKLANELTENISLDLMCDHWLGMIRKSNIDSFAALEITAN